jgi:DNA-binding response OmpR family regulator
VSGTILIVDDEADVRRYLSTALEDEGFRVVSAENALAGLSLLSRERPDVVCLDLVLPGQTGLSFYREIRETPEFAHLPVVVVTGIARFDAESRLGLGSALPAPDAYFDKPVDLRRFLAAIRDLVRTGDPT